MMLILPMGVFAQNLKFGLSMRWKLFQPCQEYTQSTI